MDNRGRQIICRLSQWLATSSVEGVWYRIDAPSSADMPAADRVALEQHSLAAQLQVSSALLLQALAAYELHRPGLNVQMRTVVKKLNAAFKADASAPYDTYILTSVHLGKTFAGQDSPRVVWWAFGGPQPSHSPAQQNAAQRYTVYSLYNTPQRPRRGTEWVN